VAFESPDPLPRALPALPTTQGSRISAWQARAQRRKTSFAHARHPVPCLG
jgi:hypothetical protein